MKISNSKKQLAKIIHENGGWRDGIRAVYGAKTKRVGFLSEYAGYPKYDPTRKAWVVLAAGIEAEFSSEPFANWHQTILSRDEYFHLYPVIETAPEPVAKAKPTIEQLAADYRNRKDYADRKQQEADDAKADADAKLAELVAAGKALGLVLSVADAVRVEPEPELVITDWLDLQVGDEVEASYRGEERLVGYVLKIDFCDSNQPIFVSDGSRSIWATEFRFIRRPAKGAADA